MKSQRRYFCLALVLCAILHSGSLLAEGFALFADQDVSELTLVATDPQAGTFRIMDRSGYVLDGALDDLVGMQGAKVTEVRAMSIVVATEEEYDWYGTTRTRSLAQIIPLAQVFEGGKGGR